MCCFQYKSDQEKSDRFANFKVFLEEADSRNTAESEAGGTAVHGITKFADLSHSEFSTLLLGYKPVLNYGAVAREAAAVKTYSGSKTLADWSESLATPVKNQGGFKSYIFSNEYLRMRTYVYISTFL